MLTTKIWAHFTPLQNDPPVILDGELVTQIVKVAPGIYTIEWADALPIPPNYVVQAFATATTMLGVFVSESVQIPRGERQVTIVCFDGFGVAVDPARVSVEIKVRT